jgi:hypothetical protein
MLIGGIDFFGFGLSKLPERRGHSIHHVRMVLLDQHFVGLLDLLNRRGG